jgi:alpha-L-rhamnosidase
VSAPTQLRIEHGPRPLGISEPSPRLSWWLPAGTRRQSAYEVAVTINGHARTSGIQTSERSILVPWPFEALPSCAVVGWRVRVETDLGWSSWSTEQEFEMGLLGPSDWSARFIRGVHRPARVR